MMARLQGAIVRGAACYGAVVVLGAGCWNAPPRVPQCGDHLVEGTEECDDGNLACRDGCTPSCQIEPDAELVVDLNTEASGDPAGSFYYAGPMVFIGSPAGCRGGAAYRVFRYEPPADGLLVLDAANANSLVPDASGLPCGDEIAGRTVLPVRGGEPLYLRQEGNPYAGSGAIVRGRFVREIAPGEACDPRGLDDACEAYSVCRDGVCAADVDLGCGVNVPAIELPPPDASGRVELTGTTGAATTHSFPASCMDGAVAQRVHRLELPHRARVRVAARGQALRALGAGIGTCRADGFVELACDGSPVAAGSSARALDLGVLEAGDVHVALAATAADYRLSIQVERLPELGEACDPGDPDAPCPEGSACVPDGAGASACVEGADAGCGPGATVIELEPWRTGGVVQVRADPVLAPAPTSGFACRNGWSGSDTDDRDFLFHLRMPYTASVRIVERSNVAFSVYAGSCDAWPACDAALGVIAEDTDLYVRASAREPFVLQLLLDRELAEADSCDPARFTDRCPIGSVCAGPPVRAECTRGGDVGCGAGTRIESLETLADGTGYFEGSTSTAVGHREMQVCDRRLGATLEVVHRWRAPFDGTAVVRSSLTGAILSARSAPCDVSATIACAETSAATPLAIEGVRAGDTLFLVLDGVPDGERYELSAEIERADEPVTCGGRICAIGEECATDAYGLALACAPAEPPAVCGDGVLAQDERCDDADPDALDGCAECSVVPYSCGG